MNIAIAALVFGLAAGLLTGCNGYNPPASVESPAITKQDFNYTLHQVRNQFRIKSVEYMQCDDKHWPDMPECRHAGLMLADVVRTIDEGAK